MIKQIIWNAVADDDFGNKYDCSFSLTVKDAEKQNPVDVQKMVDFAINQFKEFHETGVIISARQVNMQ